MPICGDLKKNTYQGSTENVEMEKREIETEESEGQVNNSESEWEAGLERPPVAAWKLEQEEQDRQSPWKNNNKNNNNNKQQYEKTKEFIIQIFCNFAFFLSHNSGKTIHDYAS